MNLQVRNSVEIAAAPLVEDALLELLNTTPTESGIRTDVLGDADAARAWDECHGGDGSLQSIRFLRDVRDSLQAVLSGRKKPASLDRFLDGVVFVPGLNDSGLTWNLKAPKDHWVAAAAVLSWAAVERDKPGRLRACANPECTRYLLDRSRPNAGQWCSMALCGNRMKARRHYQRATADLTGNHAT